MNTRTLMISGLILMSSLMPQVFGASEQNLDPIPSCGIGVFVTDDVQCYVSDSPPCSEPSIEKNGLCVVKKIDICDEEGILVDGFCRLNDGNFRVDNPTFTKQNLRTGETLGDVPNTFGWFVLAMSLFIVFAYVVMKVKKRK